MYFDRKKLSQTKQEISHAIEERRLDLDKKTKQPKGKLPRAFGLAKNFELLSSYLYKLRLTSNAANPLLVQTEDYISEVASEIIVNKSQKKEKVYKIWLEKYRQIWLRHFSLFLMVTALFVGSCLIGWIIATQYTDYALAL